MSVRHAQTRESVQYQDGGKAKAVVWFAMMPVGVHLHTHTPTHTCTLCLSRVTLHHLKSRASGGNSLKSAASSAFEAMIPLEWQQQHYLQSAACFCVCVHHFYSIFCSVFISILLTVVYYMYI